MPQYFSHLNCNVYFLAFDILFATDFLWADAPKVIFVGFENYIAKIIGVNDLNRGYSFPIPRFVYFGDHWSVIFTSTFAVVQLVRLTVRQILLSQTFG